MAEDGLCLIGINVHSSSWVWTDLGEVDEVGFGPTAIDWNG
jgi:hypothetical protein